MLIPFLYLVLRWNTDACVAFDGSTNHSFIQELKANNITPKDSVVEFWE